MNTSVMNNILTTGKTRTTAINAALFIEMSNLGRPSGRTHTLKEVQPHPTAEQLFAGAWSACFMTSVKIVAEERKVILPADMSVDVEVDLGQTGAEYFLQARINLLVPGIPHEIALAIAHAADEICPYSKAMRENIDVELGVGGQS
jgi:Ohr subfamily peroxiredoxin